MRDRNSFRKKLLYSLLVVFVMMVGVLIYLVITDKRNLEPKKEPIDDPVEPIIPSNPHTNMDVTYFEDILNTNNINYLENGFNSIEDLNNQEKLQLLFLANNDYIKQLDKITGEEVNNYFKKYYNTTVINENVNCDNNYCYIYDSNIDEYIENSIDESLLNQYRQRKVYTKTTNYEQNDNTYILTTYELYEPKCIECLSNTSYFASMIDAINNTNLLIEVPSEYSLEEIIEYNNKQMYSQVFETNFEIYKNVIPYNTYTFKKINNDYVLVSYIINRLD